MVYLNILGSSIYEIRFEYNAYMFQFKDKSWYDVSPTYKSYIQQASCYVHSLFRIKTIF